MSEVSLGNLPEKASKDLQGLCLNASRTYSWQRQEMCHDPAQGWPQNLCLSHSFLCRGVAVDSQSRLATFELTSEATIRFIADLADFFLVRLPMRVAVCRLRGGEVGAVPGWQKGFLALVWLDARSPSRSCAVQGEERAK